MGETLSGDGPDDFVCGQCFAPIAAGFDAETLEGRVLTCPECGATNRVAPR